MTTLTCKQIKAAVGLSGKYSLEVASEYKSYFKYIKEITKKFSYEYKTSLKCEGSELLTIIELTYTNGNVSGQSKFLIPANNYFEDQILILLSTGKNGTKL